MASGEELRQAMRRFPSGVAVVTVDDGGHPLGTTIGSLVSLSLEPALVGLAVGHQSSLHAPLRSAGRFAVSILAGDQEHVAQHFARGAPPIALWHGIPVRDGPGPERLIDGALAWLECGVLAEHEAGDHTIVVGAVVSTALGRRAPGLVYVEGSYRSA